jgi:hypothetical protein
VQDKDAWVSALRLADKWQMPVLRENAITKLTTLVTDPAEKIDLSVTFDVQVWMLPSLMEFVNRPGHLSVDDIHKIGIQLSVEIIATRERRLQLHGTTSFRQSCSCSYSQYCGNCTKRGTLLNAGEPNAHPALFTEEQVRMTFNLA